MPVNSTKIIRHFLKEAKVWFQDVSTFQDLLSNTFLNLLSKTKNNNKPKTHNLLNITINYLDLFKEPDRDRRGDTDLDLRGETDRDLR